MITSLALFAESGSGLFYILKTASIEGQAIIGLLAILSIFAWSVMVSKGLQMRRARSLNELFLSEFRSQESVMDLHTRRIQVEGCPLFVVYQEGCTDLDKRLNGKNGERKPFASMKTMEHVKRSMEGAVARESLGLESGLILLAIAVSGAPFLGLLGTVWGVMNTFAAISQTGNATLVTMAPGVSSALATTVAGLLVAIPSMFAYNYLVHNLRVHTVELDNFAQELASKLETEHLVED
ncbi:MAG: MotA/TolQ/ExbB proton channel family protein [Verrucomicrobiia bacterium]|jgi:biopolymer transport protein ExbB/TolQ